MTRTQAEEALRKKTQEVGDLYKSHMTDSGEPAFTPAEYAEFRDRSAELEEIRVLYQGLTAADATAKTLQAGDRAGDRKTYGVGNALPTGDTLVDGSGQPIGQKSLAQIFTQSEEYKTRANHRKNIEVNLPEMVADNVVIRAHALRTKALMEESAGFAPFVPREPFIIFTPQQVPVVSDLIPQDPTDQTAIKYMLETSYVSEAQNVAEGAYGTGGSTGQGDSTLNYTEQTIPIVKIFTWIPATEEQIEDVTFLESTINKRLGLMLLQQEDAGLLTGNGTGDQLQGYLSTTGVNTQPFGADSILDACFKGLTKVQFVGFANPTGWVFNPFDWQNVRLQKTTTGSYLLGDPDQMGVPRLWGLPVVRTTFMPQGTILTGDFQMYAHISRRRGVTIHVTDSHADYFVAGKLAIRIDERLSQEIYRPSAFTTITGVPAAP